MFGGTRARAGGCGGELEDRAGGSQRIVSSDSEPLNRISHHEALFNKISNKFCRFLIANYIVVLGGMLVFAGVTNYETGVWKSNLSTSVRDKYSETMSPGAGCVIEMFPLPVWKGMMNFVPRGGGGGEWGGGGSGACHATLVACSHSLLIFYGQRRRRLP